MGDLGTFDLSDVTAALMGGVLAYYHLRRYTI